MTISPPWPILSPGLWARLATDATGKRRRHALFLDRDGVIVEDADFLSDPARVRLVPGAAALIGRANLEGVPVVVVTNQSGIDRGLFGWDIFAAVEAEIARRLAAEGTRLDATIACPFHPDFTPGFAPLHDRYRKPGPGMIELACERMGIMAGSSWMIGDRERDCEAARAAGLAGAILLASDAAAGPAWHRDASPGFRLERCDGLETAARLLEAPLFGAGRVPPETRDEPPRRT